jgi:hypothetical protein
MSPVRTTNICEGMAEEIMNALVRIPGSALPPDVGVRARSDGGDLRHREGTVSRSCSRGSIRTSAADFASPRT